MPVKDPMKLLRIFAVFFVLAVVAVRLTRYDGGVAFLWFATPYLIAEMSVAPRRNWPAQLIVAAIASIAATGAFGMGWLAALPMAAANLAEASVCAHLLRRRARGEPLDSLSWLFRFAVAAVIAAPLAGAMIAHSGVGARLACAHSRTAWAFASTSPTRVSICARAMRG